jgi:hypothetical protein
MLNDQKENKFIASWIYKNNLNKMEDYKNDYVLLLEKSSKNLSLNKQGGDYFLEGVAAVFGIENSNHRIYEENEYLPHLDYLSKKIEQKRLLGELDHPKEFDVSLKNISHIVTSLTYDKSKRCLKIKVKLLDTPAGKIARSLVDAGIPISISSRAAGNVKENKKVEIKKIFTYDLVADPGFENAQLERVYESLGSSSFEYNKKNSVISNLSNINESFGLEKNSNLQIYRIKDTEKISRLLKENSNNKKNMSDNFVTAEELNEWSMLVNKEQSKLNNEINSLKDLLKKSGDAPLDKEKSSLEERIERLEKYSDYLAENLESSIKYGDYLAENLEGSISYNKYLAENLDKAITYAKYLAEHVDGNISYSEYISENVDKNISYSKYLAEKLDKNISYSEYLAENVDKNISYSEYLAENLDKNISYSEYLAENVDKNISYSEYLAENVDKNISYSEYLAENVDKNISYSEYLAENLDKNISYSEYLAENVDKNISYSEYLAENLDKNISYSEYLAENVDKNISYSEYLAEKVKTGIEYSEYIAENLNGNSTKKQMEKDLNESVSQGKRTSGFSGNYTSLSTKVDQLIESVNNKKLEETINENKYSFLKLVDNTTKEGFLSLNEAEKQKVVQALKGNDYNSGTDVVRIMGSALTEQANSGMKFLDMMPEDCASVWEGLNEAARASIIAQSKFYKLETPYQINHFWRTRPGFSVPAPNLEKLNESQIQDKAAKNGISNSYIQNIAAELEKRFK